MKKFLILLCSAAYLVACNNQAGTSESSSKDSSAEKNSVVNTAPASTKGSCGDIALFRKGTVIEGKTYDGSGQEVGGGTTTVQDVTTENGVMVSNVEIKGRSKTYGERAFHVKYICNGKSLSYDLASMMSSFNLSKTMKVEGDAIEFPFDISTGQTLPEASYTITMGMAGKNMVVKSTVKDRKVEGTEKITTEGGSWDCFKITSHIDASVSVDDKNLEKTMGEAMKKTMGDQYMSMWFAPGIGIIKMEMHQGDKLMMRSEMTSIK